MADAERIKNGYFDLTDPEIRAACDAAIAGGVTVVRPEPNEVLLDLDTSKDVAHFNNRVRWLNDIGGLNFTILSWESSGGNTHIKLVFDRDISPMEHLAISLALGSDRTRGLLSLFRYWNGCRDYSILFRPKDSGIAVDPRFQL